MLSELTDEDEARLAEQRSFIREEIRTRYGQALADGRACFEQLQRLLGDGAFKRSQRYELQSLGVCFGDTLCLIAPFRWAMITDEYGRDPTLQWKQTSITIHALTMISKRVEAGEEVEVARLADKSIERASAVEQQL